MVYRGAAELCDRHSGLFSTYVAAVLDRPLDGTNTPSGEATLIELADVLIRYQEKCRKECGA